jgi:hypothetical protein
MITPRTVLEYDLDKKKLHSIPKLLIFYLYLTIRLIQKIITYFTMICFINKENSNTTHNFIYLNKMNDQT